MSVERPIGGVDAKDFSGEDGVNPEAPVNDEQIDDALEKILGEGNVPEGSEEAPESTTEEGEPKEAGGSTAGIEGVSTQEDNEATENTEQHDTETTAAPTGPTTTPGA